MKKFKVLFVVSFVLFGLLVGLISPRTANANESMDQLTDQQRSSVAVYNYLCGIITELEGKDETDLNCEIIKNDLDKIKDEYIDESNSKLIEDLKKTIDQFANRQDTEKEINIIYSQETALAIKKGLGAIKKTVSDTAGKIKNQNYGDAVVTVMNGGIDVIDSMLDWKLAHGDKEWATLQLSKEEKDTINNCSKELVEYRKYLRTKSSIPDEVFLDSEMIVDFKNKIQNDDADQRWLYLKDHDDDYISYGDYWLAMAKCAYETGNYEECLEAIDEYDSLGTNIFYKNRKDRSYAEILPFGIAAASRTKAGSEMTSRLEYYSEKILENCEDDDWDLRYAAATAYISIYGETNNKEKLNDAYEEIKTNVGYLTSAQRTINERYVQPLPKGASKAEKKNRETELPYIYQPLLINLELLTILSEEIDVSEDQYSEVYDLLHNSEGESYIQNEMLDRYYGFTGNHRVALSDIDVSFEGDELSIPVEYTSEVHENADVDKEKAEEINDIPIISVEIKNSDGTTQITDWILEKVVRSESEGIDDFKAVYSSKNARKEKWQADSQIKITVTPVYYDVKDSYVFEYQTKNNKETLKDKLNVLKDKFIFERIQ